MSKEKQIIGIKECIDAVYGADCAYYDVDGFAIANEIYNAGYRKQGEDDLVTLGMLLEIINRQKAEIERLQKHNTEFARKHYSDDYNEAFKKFEERLKEYGHPIHSLVDNLVKEMMEENNEL